MRIGFKTIFIVVLVLALIGLAAYSGYRFSFTQKYSNVEKEVMLEKINQVVKLGTVEGVFSEIYDYSDMEFYNIFPSNPFSFPYSKKKALIRIKAKVLVGFDLDSMEYNINYLTQTITISKLPPPEIISIDHDLEYYDITEGYFNKFSAEDYNMLQKDSKEFIREKAQESELFESAKKQLNQNLELLNWAMEDVGWKIEIKPKAERRLFN